MPSVWCIYILLCSSCFMMWAGEESLCETKAKIVQIHQYWKPVFKKRLNYWVLYSQGSPENVEDNGCPPIVLIGCLGRAKIVLNENLFTYNLFILDQICTVLWKDKQDFCCVIHVPVHSKYDGWKLNQLNVCFNVLSTTISVIYVNWQSPKDSNSFNGLSTISADSTLEFYKI